MIDHALSDRKGDVVLNICRKRTVSSLYPPDGSFWTKFPDAARAEVMQVARVQADTLDNQLNEHDVKDVDFIKLDVHGHEIAILRGARQAVASTVGMEIEVCFGSLYKGGARFSAIHDFVETMGFELFDLRRYFWSRKEVSGISEGRRGQLVFGDALYFRSPEAVMASGANGSKILHAACVYIVYGYFDLAAVLHSLAVRENRISRESGDQFVTILSRFRRRRIVPNFGGRGRIAATLQAVGRRIAPNSWFDSDFGVGNS